MTNGFIESKPTTRLVGPKGHRTEVADVTLVFHTNLDCEQIQGSTFAGTPQEAGWDCDYCNGGLAMESGPIPGEDVPLPVLPGARIDGGRSGARRNQFGDARRPSEAQERYIRSLLRQLGSDADEWITDCERRGVWTKRESSRLIDGLKAQLAQVGPDPAAKAERRANRFGGKCVKCNGWVDAEAGYLTGSKGNWGVEHKDGECPLSAPPVAEMTSVATKAEPPEGIHLLDGVVFKVQVAKQGSGRLYAKRLDVTKVTADDGSIKYVGAWDYEGRSRAFHALSDATLMSVEQAAEFGHLYGICGVCGADLTKEESIERGIGPVCFGRLGG